MRKATTISVCFIRLHVRLTVRGGPMRCDKEHGSGTAHTLCRLNAYPHINRLLRASHTSRHREQRATHLEPKLRALRRDNRSALPNRHGSLTWTSEAACADSSAAAEYDASAASNPSLTLASSFVTASSWPSSATCPRVKQHTDRRGIQQKRRR